MTGGRDVVDIQGALNFSERGAVDDANTQSANPCLGKPLSMEPEVAPSVDGIIAKYG
jgi:hypothetical protein